ncbi:AMP-binding protein [Alphaproteobacteria bacterium]|nr:AMP-binding protein [Alphaproteobacteria bacterium]
MAKADFETLAQVKANYVPLSPLSYLARAKDVFGDRDAVVYGARRYSWREVDERAKRLASGLESLGITKSDVVTVIAANTPEMVEAHFGVPLTGGVLNTMNVRLDPETIAYVLDHAETSVLITDTQFAPAVKAALELIDRPDMQIVDIVDEQMSAGEQLGSMTYEDLLARGSADRALSLPEDEWDAIALNYTSGTSGRPKGVVYHHRGSYLMTMGTIAGWDLPAHPRYLYTVPMFHCNGWGHAWTMAAVAGTIVCIRDLQPKAIFDALVDNDIDHFGGAPVILGMLVNAPEEDRRVFTKPIKVMTAGAPPAAAVLAKTKKLGMDVLQVYGLTETYGHVIECVWQDQWNDLPENEQASIKARQGVRFPMTEEVSVVDLTSRERVAADGETQGEIVIRGNTVMKGYFKNQVATDEAFEGGAFRSGDIAVVHPNGYVEVKDRLKDVIISGGENISSVEVEAAIYQHSSVAVAAVVARPDEKWGETPCAFVELKEGTSATEEEIIAHCRSVIASFKCPKKVVFGELPKTATGKIQKFVLRQTAKDI